MKALVKYKKGMGYIEVREVQKPAINSREVLIKVKFAGICGTDIHIWHDQFPYWPPVVLGHEFSGEIVKIGSSVEGWKVGDRVVGEPHTRACGVCQLCRTGNIQICEQKRSPGWGIDGAFTSYIKMPAYLLHKVPDNVSFEEAAIVEPAAIVAHHVLERGRVEPGDFIAIFGAGPIGLLAAMMARAAGASKVMIVGTSIDEKVRFKVAKKISVDYIVNVQNEDPVKKVMDFTNGIGADLVVEASGAEPAINQAVKVVRKMGRISAIGLTGKNRISLPWDAAIFKVCNIIFNQSSSYTGWNKVISLLSSDKINLAPIITHKVTLEEWETAFEAVEKGEAVKILFVPEE